MKRGLYALCIALVLFAAGVLLTRRRLMDIGWPAALIALYMIPWGSLPNRPAVEPADDDAAEIDVIAGAGLLPSAFSVLVFSRPFAK